MLTQLKEATDTFSVWSSVLDEVGRNTIASVQGGMALASGQCQNCTICNEACVAPVSDQTMNPCAINGYRHHLLCRQSSDAVADYLDSYYSEEYYEEYAVEEYNADANGVAVSPTTTPAPTTLPTTTIPQCDLK